MKSLDAKLNLLRENSRKRKIRIMIVGLGSVGEYVLDDLLSTEDERIELYVVGRSREKMQSDVNIVNISSLIRGQNRTKVHIMAGTDLGDVSAIQSCIEETKPDIILNSSRAYSGLKYGSISWANVRAYGIWTPLSIKYTKNLMEAYEKASCDAVVINTSYSDAVIPWLKSAGKAYPDFGSGNVNHLIPRIKMAVAAHYEIEDFWNIDVTLAASHFHDVCISKEGHTNGVPLLTAIRYKGEKLTPDITEIFAACKIPMPVDAKRNMMNASSDFEIIESILDAVRDKKTRKIHSPGFGGNLGGYPVIIDGSQDLLHAHVDETDFSLSEMIQTNHASLYLDGIEKVTDGTLFYTDELREKTQKAFGIELMKSVRFDEIESAADYLIRKVIEPHMIHQAR